MQKTVAWPLIDVMKQRDDMLSKLIAISVDRWGSPIGLFTTYRWVTAENWYAAADVISMHTDACHSGRPGAGDLVGEFPWRASITLAARF